MSDGLPEPITQLLAAATLGDDGAKERLWLAIYDELHGMAQRQMVHEAPGCTLQPTALVHEAYLRLIGDGQVEWANRRHFFAAAAKAMRRICLDDARTRKRLKRGGGQRRQPLGDGPVIFDGDPADVLAMDEALDGLEAIDPRKAEVVALRYYAGLTVKETAHALEVSERTVNKEWHVARAWLFRELTRTSRQVDHLPYATARDAV